MAASAAASTGLFSPQVLETLKSIIVYIGVLGGAIVVAFKGIRSAIRDLKADEKASIEAVPGGAKILGATILEHTTLLMWSESNREVTEAIDQLTRAINYNTEAQRENGRSMSEVKHQIERLRDKMT
jgi:hypothetical protein